MTGQGQGRVVAVVVTYNRLAKLQVTIARLLQADPDHLEAVLVVDNASTDGTAMWLDRQADPRLKVLRSETNIGGAGGFEAGLRSAAKEFDPDWFLVMDDDARPHEGALAAFHGAERSGAEGWGAAVYHMDGRICDMNRPSKNPFWHRGVMRKTLTGGGRDGFHLGPEDYAAGETRDVDALSFVGLFLSRRAIELAGYPDGSLFIYGDDVLYTLGLTRAGGRLVFDPAIGFEHDFTTHSGEDRRFRPLWKCYYHYRNLLMVYQFCSGWLFVFVAPAAAVKWLLKVRFHSGERRAFLKYALRALWHGIRHKTDVPHETVLSWGRK